MKNLHFSPRPTGRFVSVVADSEPAAGALSDGCRGGTRFFWPIAMPGFLTHRHIWKSEKWPHPISRTTGFIFGAKPRIPRVVWTFPRWASRDRREGRDYGLVDFPQHLLWVGYIRMLVLFVDFGAAVYPFSISISLDDIPVHWQVSKIVHEDGHCRFNIISCTTFSFSSAHWSD